MPRPYVSQVEIKNFRNFQHLSLSLQPTVVVVGENRSGKTNLLEALRLVLDSSLPDSQRILRAEDFWDGLEEPFAGNVVEVKVFVRGFDHLKEAQCVLCDCVSEEGGTEAVLTYQFRPRKGIDLDEATEDDYEFVVFGGLDEKIRVGSEVRKWISLLVLPALRDAEATIRSWRRSPLRPLLERARKGISGDALAGVRDSLDSALAELLEEQSITGLVEQINDQVRQLVGPIYGIETHFDFASSEPEELLRSVRLFLRETNSRPLADSSLGTSNILFLALLLQDISEKQDAKELVTTILAVEEPEAHLHPHLQRLLFRHFLSRENSVIVTTHSPNIASVAPINSLILLRGSRDASEGFTIDPDLFTAQETVDLQRYIDVTKAEMVFAKGILLVEGTAEQFLIPQFAASRLKEKQIAGSLDALGISVSSVNGTDFTPYRKFLLSSGLAIPHAVVTDGDPTEKDESTIWNGNVRGANLIFDEDLKEEVERLNSEAQFGESDKLLAEDGIFVGNDTLEIDLIPTLKDEMIETYSEFQVTSVPTKRFSQLMSLVYEKQQDHGENGIDPDELKKAKSNILRRIEKIGKGRYAQRLASKIDDHEPPEYITSAIDYIVDTVMENND